MSEPGKNTSTDGGDQPNPEQPNQQPNEQEQGTNQPVATTSGASTQPPTTIGATVQNPPISQPDTPTSDDDITLHEDIKITIVKSDKKLEEVPDTASITGETSSTVTLSAGDITDPSTVSTTELESRDGTETPTSSRGLTPPNMSTSQMSITSTTAVHGSLGDVSEITDDLAADVEDTLNVSGSEKKEFVVSGSPRKGKKTSEGTIDPADVMKALEEANQAASNGTSLLVGGSPRKGKVVSATTSPVKTNDPGNYLNVSGTTRKGHMVKGDSTGSEDTESTSVTESDPKTDLTESGPKDESKGDPDGSGSKDGSKEDSNGSPDESGSKPDDDSDPK